MPINLNTPVGLQNANLSQNFQGPQDFQSQLHGGIDYFGNLGLSQGLQNIALQRNTANNALANSLGNNPGNAGLLGVLQNQNLFKSHLAGNPLFGQAQQDTANRVEQQINLQNALTQLKNSTQMQQLGFNNQNALSQLQTKLALGQPQQNLLDILSGLQGQARGVSTTEGQTLGKNFT
jgi:hypothetical protein